MIENDDGGVGQEVRQSNNGGRKMVFRSREMEETKCRPYPRKLGIRET